MKNYYFVLFAVIFTYTLNSQVFVNPVLDTQRLAIVPFDYAEDGTEIPVSEIEEAFFTSPNSMKAFYEEASYGKMTLDGTVYLYRTGMPPLYGVGYTNCYPMDSVIANQSDVDYTNIDGIVLFPHDTASDKSCSAGVSSFEKLPFTTKDGPFEFRRSGFRTDLYFPNDFSGTVSSTIAHELLHSFGNGFHSNSYIKNDGEWVLQGYGNVFDILGLRSQASHPCSMIKHKLGWLTENEIDYVVETDTFRIYPLEKTLPGQTQCLIIELDNLLDIQPEDTFVFDRLYLEYRGLTGFDARSDMMRRVRLKDGTYFPNNNLHGLSIVGVDCSSSEECLPVLVDTHPDPIGGIGANYFPHEASDAPLKLGEIYYIENNSIEIEVIEVNEENYIDVAIRMSPPSSVTKSKLSDIKIFPSPITDYINIENNFSNNYKANLFDLNGNLVLSEINSSKIDAGNISPGVYILIISDLNTNQITTKRIIKI